MPQYRKYCTARIFLFSGAVFPLPAHFTSRNLANLQIIMKKHLFILFAALITAALLPSCNDSEGDYPEYWSFATVKTLDNNDYYFLLDDQKTAYPGDKTRIAGYEAKDGQRTVIYFNILPVQKQDYDNNIELYSIENILTKDAVTITTQEEMDEIGDDRIRVIKAWLAGQYLNITFEFPTSGSTKHFINVIENKLTPSETATEGYLSLEFRHNAYNDTHGLLSSGIASFKIDQLDTLTDKGISLRIKNLQGEISYLQIELTK